jgi:hypothetical protein
LTKHNEHGSKLEEDVSSLLSKFALGEIRFALVATLAKLGLDIFLQLQKEKRFFMAVMFRRGGLHHLCSKSTKSTQAHHDEVDIIT